MKKKIVFFFAVFSICVFSLNMVFSAAEKKTDGAFYSAEEISTAIYTPQTSDYEPAQANIETGTTDISAAKPLGEKQADVPDDFIKEFRFWEINSSGVSAGNPEVVSENDSVCVSVDGYDSEKGETPSEITAGVSDQNGNTAYAVLGNDAQHASEVTFYGLKPGLYRVFIKSDSDAVVHGMIRFTSENKRKNGMVTMNN